MFRPIFFLLLLCAVGVSMEAQSVIRIPQVTRDLIYLPELDRIYATVPASASSNSHTIKMISTGGRTHAPIPAPGNPGIMAAKSATELYVAKDDLARIDVVSVPSGNIISSIPLALDRVVGIEPMPGNPGVIAVTEAGYDTVETWIYDQGLRRSNNVQTHNITWSTDGMFTFGRYNTGGSHNPIYRMIGGTTNAFGSINFAVLDSVVGNQLYIDGLLYLSSGHIVNSTNFAVVGAFPGYRFYPSVALSRDGMEIAFLSYKGPLWSLEVFKRATLERLSRVEFPNITSSMAGLIAYGTRSYAFRSDTEVFLAPREAAVNLAVSQSLSPEFLEPGEEFTYTIVTTNQTGTATDVTVEALFSGLPFRIERLVASSGQARGTGSSVIWNPGNMASGASSTLQIVGVPEGNGVLTGKVSIVGLQADTEPLNNTAVLTSAQVQSSAETPYVAFEAAVHGMGYDPLTDRVIAIGPSYRHLTFSGAHSAAVKLSMILPERLGPELAVMSNGDVYVAMENSGTVQQVRADGTIGMRFNFTHPSGSLLQIIPVPGSSNQMIIKTSTSVSLYSGGVRQPRWLPPGDFVFKPDGSEGYHINYQGGIFSKVVVGPDGLNITSSTALWGVSPGRLSYAAGKIFMAGGVILDAATGAPIGTVPDLQNVPQVLASHADGKVYTLWHDYITWYISAYDSTTMNLLRRWPIPGFRANPSPMISIGPNRLAVRVGTDQSFFIYPERIRNPDLQVEHQITTQEDEGRTTNVIATITLKNIGALTSTNSFVQVDGSNLTPLSGQTTTGTFSPSGAGLGWSVGNLAPGATATIEVSAVPMQAGAYKILSTAQANLLEINRLNNSAESIGMIHGAFTPLVMQMNNLRARDLAWEPASSNFVFLFEESRLISSPSLLNYHPDSGRFSDPVPLPYAAVALATLKGSNSVLVAGGSPVKISVYNPSTGSLPTLTSHVTNRMADIINVSGLTNLWLLPFADAPATAVFANVDERYPFTGAGYYGASGLTNIYLVDPVNRTIKVLAHGFPGLVEKNTSFNIEANSPFVVSGHRLIFQSGAVINGENGEWVGHIPPGQQPFFAVEPESGRIYLLSHDWGQWTVRVYDEASLTLLAQIKVNGLTDVPLELVPWGNRGAAFLTQSGQFYIVEIPTSGAPLSLTMNPVQWTPVLDNLSRISFRITNPSPVVARNVSFTAQLPASFDFVSGVAGNVSGTFTNGIVSAIFPSVPAESSLELIITFRPRDIGEFAVTAAISSTEVPDPTTDDNEINGMVAVRDLPVFSYVETVFREGSSQSGNGIVGRLEFPVGHSVTVRVSRELLTTTASDFWNLPVSTWTFSAGRTSIVQNISIRADGILEGDEYFALVVTNIVGARVLNDTALFKIVDSDAPGLSVPDVEWTENDAAETEIQVPVNLSFPLNVPSRVRYSTVSATALPGQDYLHQEGSVEFAAGSISSSIPITVLGNDTPDATRSFGIVFFDAEFINIVKNYVTVLIRDDDTEEPPGLLRLSSARTEDGEFEVSFPSQLRKKYILESSTLLHPGNWTPAGEIIEGSGHTVFRSVQLSGKPNSYFRVRELP